MSAISSRPVQETRDGVCLRIKAVPRARTSAVAGLHGDTIRIRLAAPPVEGRANGELVRFLAETLQLPPRMIGVVSGESSTLKVVRVLGLPAAEVARRLGI